MAVQIQDFKLSSGRQASLAWVDLGQNCASYGKVLGSLS